MPTLPQPEITLSPDQTAALDALFVALRGPNREAVLAGAAGTGKTTLMRAVLAQLHFNVVKHEPNPADSAESKVYLSKLLPAELARRHRSVRTVVYSE